MSKRFYSVVKARGHTCKGIKLCDTRQCHPVSTQLWQHVAPCVPIQSDTPNQVEHPWREAVGSTGGPIIRKGG